MTTNEKKIDEICHQEGRIQQAKEWLIVLFFLVIILMAAIFYKALSAPVVDNGKAAVITIIITLSVFAGLLISGYFCDKFLSKKLDKLYEQKQLLS